MSRIKNPSLEWQNEAPFSLDFGDIYFNRAGGLAETSLVFLEGNRLPHAWQHQKQFTIAETGFGTGLNFLAAWQLFEGIADPEARLDFISVEQFPLHKDDLQRALQTWRGELSGDLIDRLLSVYPPRIPGFHRRWLNDRVTLTLIFDDALRAYKQVEAQVDAWFLDGFSPAKNPQLWQEQLFQEIARLSHNGTTLGSFTAAGDVRRGLEQVGFHIERQSGFGHKRHRITGVFNGWEKLPSKSPETLHIVGAGLAGLAMAYACRRRGIATTVYEQNDALGIGASGNKLGLINSKIEAQDNPRNDAGLSAFSFAQHILSDISDIDYRQSGSLHLAVEDKADRLQKLYEMQGWLEPHLRWITAQETEEVCGLAVPYEALFYPDAGTVDNRKLLQQLAQNARIYFGKTISSLDKTTIWCNGWGLARVAPSFPLQPVRGQVTYVTAPAILKCPIMFGHYIAPVTDQEWAIGASFQQNQDNPDIQTQDDASNMAAANEIISIGDVSLSGHWANIRTASRDRFPIVGALPGQPDQYVLGALGSHGIQFSFLLAEILACQLTGAPMPIGRDALETVSSQRFESRR